jgi:hypothetical protein
MPATPDGFITIGVYQNSMEAALAQNQLEAAGIKAYVSGQETEAMAWAGDGVKVQVAAEDMDDALFLLEKKPWTTKCDEDETAFATADDLKKIPDHDRDEEAEEIETDREKNAGRALRASIFGLTLLGGVSIAGLGFESYFGQVVFVLLFLSFEFYALRLLVEVLFSPERLAGRPRAVAKLAAFINTSSILWFVFLVVTIVLGPFPKKMAAENDLLALAHPKMLVGVWKGTSIDEKGESHITLELNANGMVHYWQTGPEEVDCMGTWADHNWTLYVCYSRFLKGDTSRKGQILGYPLAKDDFKETEMNLKTASGKLRLVRQQ